MSFIKSFRKPAFIEFYDGAIIRSLTTHTEKKHGVWNLKIIAHLESKAKNKEIKGNINAILTVDGYQTIKIGKQLEINTRDDGTCEAQLNMSISEVGNKLRYKYGSTGKVQPTEPVVPPVVRCFVRRVCHAG